MKKIIISVGGRFHSFNLAQELLKRDALKFIITSYPKFITRKWNLPDDKVKSIFIKEILDRAYRKLPIFLQDLYNPQYFICDLFDKLVLKKLEKADIFVGWSSFSLYSLRKAKELGMKTILERGSSHIVYQYEILKEEYEKWSYKPSFDELPHPKIIEKELKEYEETDYISVPSLFVKKTFLDNGISEKKILCVQYGVDLTKFKKVPKEDNIFRIIFAGTICLRKGVQYLVKAFNELNLLNSELILLGNIAEDIKKFLIKHQDNLKIKIKKIDHFDLYKEYSNGSIFVLPSIEEGLARVIPEAMACGLPVICTTNTGGEDIVRNGIDGFIIPIRDVEKLKEKILYFYENPEITKQMGQNAQNRVKSGFSWSDYGEKIYNNYLEVLK
ncbi:MAG: glycosyltransferase family 4 protein [Candidatus Goldbacteria bacterium]|nr:glycosyltransferase family 4 protein [Candidatus Goldiibacteriota bacterium]